MKPPEGMPRLANFWDGECARVWKAHPANAWFAYEAGVYIAKLGRGGAAPKRTLKTDAFDEACGRNYLRQALGTGAVLIDISPRVVAQAAAAQLERPVVCATDVRRLPFRSGTFDLILSTSTLDHFDRRDEIHTAFAELQRVLRADGRLFVTFDNPSNPILRARKLVYRLTGSLGGLMPFHVGHTLSRRALVRALEQTGFEVFESGYVVHAPRVAIFWAAEWAARRGFAATAHALVALLQRIEWAAGVLPTRRWTAHFTFAYCRPRAATPVDGLRAAGTEPTPVWLSFWKNLELRLRCAYVQSLPVPVLARIDPPLRRAVGLLRYAAAAPLYLRQPLTRWEGSCGEGTGRVAVWGASLSRNVLFGVLFDGKPVARRGASLTLPTIARQAGTMGEDSELLIVHTTPALAPLLRRSGFLIVPAMVRFAGEPHALVAAQAHPSKSLGSDLRQVERAGYRTELWPYSAERSRLFYDRYMLPHARMRFGDQADVPSFSWVDRFFAAGLGLALHTPGSREPDVIGLVLVRGDVLRLINLGTRDADPAILHTGGLAALYQAAIRFAVERRMRLLDVGRCRPWGSDGVFGYKWKWGFRPVPDMAQTFEHAVKVLRPGSAVARRLVEHRVVVRDGQRYRLLACANDLNG